MKTRFLPVCAGLLLALSSQVTIADDMNSSAAPANSAVATTDKNASQSNVLAILTNLKNKGYPVIYKVEVDDGVIKVKALDVQGRDIKLKFDAQGNMIEPKDPTEMGAKFSMLDAIKKVLDSGYTNITSAEPEDEDYEIKATGKDGKEVKLTVNSTTGDIKQ